MLVVLAAFIRGQAVHGEPAIAAVPARVISLIADMPAAGSLAAPATGQTVYIVDEVQGTVVGCDPFHPAKRWPVLAPPAEAAGRPVAIACIDSSTLAAVARENDVWTLRTYRLEAPGADAGSLAPRSTHPLGAVTNDDRPQLIIGLSRDWMVATGLAPPGPRMHLFAIRGTQPALLATREASGGHRIVAAAATPGNGLAVFEVEAPETRAAARISLHAGVHARPLLVLDTGLPGIRAAASSRSSGDLWVVGGEPGSDSTPEGLWRIESTLHDRKQAARAVCVARLEAPRALVWISDRMILVTHGTDRRQVSHVDPSGTFHGDDVP